MQGYAAVARSEILRLYRRPLPWLVLAVASLLMAVFYLLLLVRYLENATELAPRGVTVEVLTRYFGSAALLMLLLMPLLALGVLGNERRDGGLRFLFTLPVTTSALVAGKLTAIASLAALAWFVVSLVPATLLWGAAIDVGVYAQNALGLALFSLFHLALGVFASALTRQGVLGALFALAASLTLWFADWANRLDPQANALGGLSTASRLRSFTVGLLNSGDVAYFVLGAGAFVALTAWRVAALRRHG